MKRMSLSTKTILRLIVIIPIIIFIIYEFRYKDLKYDMGESTGYILEIKHRTNKVTGFGGKFRVKQEYNVKENDYISESLEKNL